MRLKRREDIECRELAQIESPLVARSWVEQAATAEGLRWIDGLTDVLRDDFAPQRHVWDHRARARPLEKIENAEVFLVHGLASGPLVPAVRSPSGKDAWKADESLNAVARVNVEWMLATLSCGIRAPVNVVQPTQQQPPPKEQPSQLTVTNPRWEHVDQKAKDQRPDSTKSGDVITLKVDVKTVPDGTRVTFRVFDTSMSPPSRIGIAYGEVVGGIGSGEWRVTPPNRGVGQELTLEFEGEVRKVISERAAIPLGAVFLFSI